MVVVWVAGTVAKWGVTMVVVMDARLVDWMVASWAASLVAWMDEISVVVKVVVMVVWLVARMVSLRVEAMAGRWVIE